MATDSTSSPDLNPQPSALGDLPEESVWSYPRPPRLERFTARIRIYFNQVCLVDSAAVYRVLETSHPPTYYIPPLHVAMQYLHAESQTSVCEWKGRAQYFTIIVGDRRADLAAWAYPAPTLNFAPIAGYLAFYASKMDACFVNEERVEPQAGDFYGGWITSNIKGPFKGASGTRHW